MSEGPSNSPSQKQPPTPAYSGKPFGVVRAVNETLTIAATGNGLLALVMLAFGIMLGFINSLALQILPTFFTNIVQYTIYAANGIIVWAIAQKLVEIRQRQLAGETARLLSEIKNGDVQITRGIIAYFASFVAIAVAYLPTTILGYTVQAIYGIQALFNPLYILVFFLVFLANTSLVLSVVLVGPVSALEVRHFALRRSAHLMKGNRIKVLVGFILLSVVVILANVFIGFGVNLLSIFAGLKISAALTNGLTTVLNLLMISFVLVAYCQIVEEKEGADKHAVADVFS